MKSRTKKAMVIGGSIAVGAAVGGAAGYFASKAIADEPLPTANMPAPKPTGKAAPVDEADSFLDEGDDGDLEAQAVDTDHMSAEDIFVKSASMPVADAADPGYVPQV